ncbi:hypothetical protein [Bartonella sp. MF74HXZ]
MRDVVGFETWCWFVDRVLLVLVLLVLVRLAIVLMYAMVLRRHYGGHYGCVSGGMRGEVGGMTYMLVNGILRRHCWRGRGWEGCIMICVSIGVGDCGCFGGGCEGGEMGRTDGVDCEGQESGCLRLFWQVVLMWRRLR